MNVRRAVVFNLLYALYHGVLAVVNRSVWFAAMCAYYMILSAMRLAAIWWERKNGSDRSVMKLCGGLLVALSAVVAGVNYISLSQNIAAKYEKITMITIAAYTFYKIGLSVTRAVRRRRYPLPLHGVIRGIGYAETAASVLTL